MAILCFTQHHFNTLNVSTRMFYNQVSDNDCKLHETINKHSSVQARERGEGYFIHFCNQDKYVYFSICHLLSALWTQCENNESWTWLQCEYLNELWALWAVSSSCKASVLHLFKYSNHWDTATAVILQLMQHLEEMNRASLSINISLIIFPIKNTEQS